MEKIVSINIPLEEFQTIFTDIVNSCLKHNKPTPPPPAGTPTDFKYIPIQDIFKKKICSKPCFYEHLKKGEFQLYKFGSKSFVEAAEFLKAFHKVQIY